MRLGYVRSLAGHFEELSEYLGLRGSVEEEAVGATPAALPGWVLHAEE